MTHSILSRCLRYKILLRSTLAQIWRKSEIHCSLHKKAVNNIRGAWIQDPYIYLSTLLYVCYEKLNPLQRSEVRQKALIKYPGNDEGLLIAEKACKI